METIARKIWFLLFAFILTGCAAMLVPETNDPAAKLRWAMKLFDEDDRPLPAERLITEATNIYQQQEDEVGLANAYRVYGIFLKSPAVVRSQKFYEKNGFADKSVTYAIRLPKALEYFERARTLLEKHHDTERLVNIYLQIGLTDQLMQRNDAACLAFDKSLEEHKKRMKKNPNLKIILPKEYSSYENGIEDIKEKGGCMKRKMGGTVN